MIDSHELSATELLNDRPLSSRADLAANRATLPDQPGIYAWFFASALGVPAAETLPRRDGFTFLYTGIGSSLRRRLMNHCNNSSGSSSLRRSLGALLCSALELRPRTYGSKDRLSFARESELELTRWLDAHARVSWMPHADPEGLETWIISRFQPPLNIKAVATEGARNLTAVRARARVGGHDLKRRGPAER